MIAPLFEKGTAPAGRDNNNWSPKVGFAWDPFNDGKTIVRGGFGVYYDNTIDNLRLFERADLGPVGAEQFLVGTAIISPLLNPYGGDGRFTRGQITLAQMLALYPSIRTDLESRLTNCSLPTGLECTDSVSGPIFSSNFQVPYSLQYSIGMQRELPWNLIAQVDFNYRKGLNEVNVFDINQADSVAGPRLAAFPVPVPYADSSAYSTYKGLLAFVFSTVYDTPWFKKDANWFKRNLLGNWTVSMISTMFSGTPQSVFLPNSIDMSGTGTFATYLPGTTGGAIGRNIRTVGQLNDLIRAYNSSLTPGQTDPFGTPLVRLAELPADTQIGGDPIYSQDLRLTKSFNFNERFRVQLIGEVFNLFNFANLVNVSDVVLPVEGTPANEITTLRPSQRSNSVFGTGGPRSFQFGARFTF